jgi:ADP-ribose diphosphatase
MMALLAEPDFREARYVSALFLSEAFLRASR